MRILALLTIAALFPWDAWAQAPIPKGDAPRIGLASAVEQDGKIVIEIFELRDVKRLKLPNAGDVFIEERHWQLLTTGTLGQDIRAYRPDGKNPSNAEVLKSLIKPQGVTFYMGYQRDKPALPDPFYLGMLKEGTVALAFDRPELAPPVLP